MYPTANVLLRPWCNVWCCQTVFFCCLTTSLWINVSSMHNKKTPLNCHFPLSALGQDDRESAGSSAKWIIPPPPPIIFLLGSYSTFALFVLCQFPLCLWYPCPLAWHIRLRHSFRTRLASPFGCYSRLVCFPRKGGGRQHWEINKILVGYSWRELWVVDYCLIQVLCRSAHSWARQWEYTWCAWACIIAR